MPVNAKTKEDLIVENEERVAREAEELKQQEVNELIEKKGYFAELVERQRLDTAD